MKIIRNNHVIELTQEELFEAHKEFMINFFEDVLNSEFACEEEDIPDIANMAYEIYAEGNGDTEYEAIEKAYEKFMAEDDALDDEYYDHYSDDDEDYDEFE